MWVMTEKFGESLENEKKPCAWRVFFESEPVGNPDGLPEFKGVSGRRPEITNPPPSQPGVSPSGQVRGQIGSGNFVRGVRSQAEA